VKNRVPELRTARGWSQGELAEKLGVSRQTVNAVERERYEPSLSLAFAIAALFGRSVEEIFEP
jgi:putative transcriptional regulator